MTNPIRKYGTRDERAWINILASWDDYLMHNGKTNLFIHCKTETVKMTWTTFTFQVEVCTYCMWQQLFTIENILAVLIMDNSFMWPNIQKFFIFSIMLNPKTDTGSYGGQRKNARGICMSIFKSPGSLGVYHMPNTVLNGLENRNT